MVTFALGALTPEYFTRDLSVETISHDIDDATCGTYTVPMPDDFESLEIYIPTQNFKVSDVELIRAKTILSQLIEMDSTVRLKAIGGDDLYRLGYVDITEHCVHITYFNNQVNSESTACFDATIPDTVIYHAMRCRLAPDKSL